METFTKEELMALYFSLMTSILKENGRLKRTKNEILRKAIQSKMNKYQNLLEKIDEMGKELCTH